MRNKIKNTVIAVGTGAGLNYIVTTSKALTVNSNVLKDSLYVWSKFGLTHSESLMANGLIFGFILAPVVGTAIGTAIKNRGKKC